MEHVGVEHVRQLGASILQRSAFDPYSPVHLRVRARPAQAIIWPTSRVGLTLKRAASHPTMFDYIGRPYRMTRALDVPKGRPHTALAMLKRGLSPQQVAKRCGARAHWVHRLAKAYTDGQSMSPRALAQTRLNALGLAALQGACDAAYGDPFFTLLQGKTRRI